MKVTRAAFSLLELILVMGIFVVLLGVGGIFSFGTKSSFEVEEESRKIVSVLRNTQSRAMAREQGSSWGVHFDNTSATSSRYEVFWGSTYANATRTDHAYFPPGIHYSSPQFGTATDVIFLERYGRLSSGVSSTIVLTASSTGFQKTVTVSANGGIAVSQ